MARGIRRSRNKAGDTGGSGLMKSVLGTAIGAVVARQTKGGGVLKAGAGALATRVAARSLPGAALVGGLLIGKHLWDWRRNRDADGKLDALQRERADLDDQLRAEDEGMSMQDPMPALQEGDLAAEASQTQDKINALAAPASKRRAR